MARAIWRGAPLVAAVFSSVLAAALRAVGPGEAIPEVPPHQALRFATSAATGRAPVISALGLTGDSKTLVIAGDDHLIRLFDMAAGRVRAELKGHTDWVRAIAISPDGTTLFSAGDDHHIRRWNLTAGEPRGDLDWLDWAIYALAISTDGSRLAAAGFEDELRIYDTASSRLLQRIKCPARDVRAVAFSPDGQHVAAAGRSGAIAIWSLAGATPMSVGQIAAHRQRIRSLAYSADGSKLLSAAEDGMVRIWDAKTREQAAEISCRPAKVMAAVFVTDERIATGGSDNRVLLWDLKTATPIVALRGHTGSVAAIACDREGKLLASGSYDTTVQIFNLTRDVIEQTRTGRASDAGLVK